MAVIASREPSIYIHHSLNPPYTSLHVSSYAKQPSCALELSIFLLNTAKTLSSLRKAQRQYRTTRAPPFSSVTKSLSSSGEYVEQVMEAEAPKAGVVSSMESLVVLFGHMRISGSVEKSSSTASEGLDSPSSPASNSAVFLSVVDSHAVHLSDPIRDVPTSNDYLKEFAHSTTPPTSAEAPKSDPSFSASARLLRREDYSIIRALDKGAFGEVQLAQDKNGNEVVLKTVGSLFDGAREVNMLSSLSHKNIMAIYGYWIEGGSVVMVLELGEMRSLASVLKYGGVMDEKTAAQYILGVIEGLEYLHSLNIIHLDLKPDNILVMYDGTIRLADFGLSGFVFEFEGDRSAGGTPGFAAPEILLGGEVTCKVDVYSMGATLLEMLTGKSPYDELETAEALKSTVADDMPLPPHISPELKDFFKLCFEKKLHHRAHVDEFLHHPWILEFTYSAPSMWTSTVTTAALSAPTAPASAVPPSSSTTKRDDLVTAPKKSLLLSGSSVSSSVIPPVAEGFTGALSDGPIASASSSTEGYYKSSFNSSAPCPSTLNTRKDSMASADKSGTTVSSLRSSVESTGSVNSEGKSVLGEEIITTCPAIGQQHFKSRKWFCFTARNRHKTPAKKQVEVAPVHESPPSYDKWPRPVSSSPATTRTPYYKLVFDRVRRKSEEKGVKAPPAEKKQTPWYNPKGWFRQVSYQ
ncbi:hypothetical protein SmJEL517_g04612 [Synchytrium microbalum]|uniref:Protein kinase domain-containing protein n=1 Tax=Synchytrium microbalum TaxID=1806994 RepID=A0A507BYI2_9FUNG|nr:uncharacterized protein SmJEL517_g04612 [Synchytrium microbalum]TPX32181.1 hypothetical protein SmJEL517_g04612 [Synchytrium microbalum]